jgi:transposase
VITKTLEEPPPHHDTHWSTRQMAKATGLSQTAISRIWRAFELKPHLVETWKLSTDPQFIDEVRDIVGLYLDPPAAALVLCVDEKSQIQALDRTAPSLPILPTTPARRTHDYVRHGTAACSPPWMWPQARSSLNCTAVIATRKFMKFLKTIDANLPADLDVHLICDNYATHNTEAIKTWFLRHPRFHPHFTPTYSSWLNLVERWFAELTTRKLRRSAHRSVAELETDLTAWIQAWNDDPCPFVWTKTADEILEHPRKISSLINNSGH